MKTTMGYHVDKKFLEEIRSLTYFGMNHKQHAGIHFIQLDANAKALADRLKDIRQLIEKEIGIS